MHWRLLVKPPESWTSASAVDRGPFANSSQPISSTTFTWVIVPIVLGRGEPLWQGQEGLEERFDIESATTPSGVTHLVCNHR